MKKGYVVGEFITEQNRRTIADTAAACGCLTEFFRTDSDAEGRVSDGEFIYCQRPHLITQMPYLKWCHTSNAGVEPFAASGIFDSGDVVLTNSSGAYGLTISEHIIMVTLMLMRRMPEYMGIMDRGEWIDDLPVRSVHGSRVVIMGTGNLGQNAAVRFRSLGAESVIGFSRSGRPVSGFDEIYKVDQFDEHIGNTDVLVLCMPGTAQTAGILSKDRLDRVPESAYVINVGRGSAIDQDELIRRLNEGSLAGAALDVMDPEPLPAGHPLRTAKNCILTPHVSGDMGLPYTVDRTVDIFCRNMKRYAEGRELINVVDISAGY